MDPRTWWACAWSLIVDALNDGAPKVIGHLRDEFEWGGKKKHLAETFGNNAANDAALAAQMAAAGPAAVRLDDEPEAITPTESTD